MSPSYSKGKLKGKQRAVFPRDEGSGGRDGIVLPLDLVGSGIYDAAYTLPLRIGRNPKSFSLQVDTGSSDLWVASTSCTTSSCGGTGGKLYDPSNATPTDVTFDITYLQGFVKGPVVWDRVEVGGYSIENQALAAAAIVTDEALTPNFNGILGLALPLNSIIAANIPPVTDNDPDGAAWASNLFSITPVASAPSARFLSLSLSRPGSDRVPSFLGIGRHPSNLVQDPSKVRYSTLVGDRSGILFWKVTVRAITVYVNGFPRSVEVGRSNTGAVFPSAVLDSGVPYILTTSKIANGIYGALGIGPGADGKYYVPCGMPLNMSITLDDRPEIPLHPLDLTAEPPRDNQAQFCIGLIQAADPQLSNPSSGIGDMILGVPFMRNTYTVMAYTAPSDDGTFSESIASTGSGGRATDSTIRPKLGLMSLTDPATALDEFNTVRLLNQPISTSNNSNGTSSGSGGKKLSVGVIVLLGLVGFFSLCCALFGIRWFLLKRRYKKGKRVGGAGSNAGNGSGREDSDNKVAFPLRHTGSREEYGSGGSADGASTLGNVSGQLKSGEEKDDLSYKRLERPRSFVNDDENEHMELNDMQKEGEHDVVTLRGLPFPKERIVSEYTMSSGRTRVDSDGVGELGVFGKDGGVRGEDTGGELGFSFDWGVRRASDMIQDPGCENREELGARRRVGSGSSYGTTLSTAAALGIAGANHTTSYKPHARSPSSAVPLLSSHTYSQSFDTDAGSSLSPVSIRHRPGADSEDGWSPEFGLRRSRYEYLGGKVSSQTGARQGKTDGENAGEEEAGGMAGIGTAQRQRQRQGSKFEPLPLARDSHLSTTSTLASLASPLLAAVVSDSTPLVVSHSYSAERPASLPSLGSSLDKIDQEPKEDRPLSSPLSTVPAMTTPKPLSVPVSGNSEPAVSSAPPSSRLQASSMSSIGSAWDVRQSRRPPSVVIEFDPVWQLYGMGYDEHSRSR